MYRGFTRVILLVLIGCGLVASVQAQVSISGVVNEYTAVGSIDYCARTIEVENGAVVEAGMSVLLIQMQGAKITIRNENFGAIEEIGSAGLFEKAVIERVSGNTITVVNSLLNTYDEEGSVQLVTIPVYSEEVTVSDTLFAAPWNGTTGGVLMIETTDGLILDAPISAAERGFRGGMVDSPENSCLGGLNLASQSFFGRGDWRGAAKGEGVARFTPSRENGKGPQANGGGGGNDHNSGGGGGAHLTVGGDGGEQETPFLTGNCKGDNPGLKGNALLIEEERIYLGGGGGAGHTNNDFGHPGGNGGGIVIIETTTIMTNGHPILAHGGSPETTVGDGASGGGAGGTVILLTSNIVGEITIDLHGGKGGDADNNNNDDCFGPGGGGSGGRLLTSISGLTPDLSGGIGGTSVGSTVDRCADGSNDGKAAENGRQAPFLGLREGASPVLMPSIVSQTEAITSCPLLDADLTVEFDAVGSDIRWQVDVGAGEGFVDIFDGVTYEGTMTGTLTVLNISPNMNGQRFRLVLRNDCFGDLISDPIPLSVITSDGAVPTFEHDLEPGGIVIFNNTSMNADSYLWDFGGGIISNMQNTSHTYAAEGDYDVTLTATNECGSVSITQTITVVFAPTAAFTINNSIGCAPITLDLSNNSSENVESYRWLFPGGTPETSTDVAPSVTYDIGGMYSITLIVSNVVGTDTLLLSNGVLVNDAPFPSFVPTARNLELLTDNTTIGATNYAWDFGDGNTSTLVNPSHVYTESGVYTVTLRASNACGERILMQDVAVGQAPLSVFVADDTKGCAPFIVQFSDQSKGEVDNWNWEFEGGIPATSTERNPLVRYNEPGAYDVTLFISNELFQDSTKLTNYIVVADQPIADFDVVFDEPSVVSFVNQSELATNYSWNFGDGTTSRAANPTHTYTENGIYYVTLHAFNEACGTVLTIPVNVILTAVEEVADGTTVSLYPNPTSDLLQLDIESTQPTPVEVRVLDLNGRLLFADIRNTTNSTLDFSNYAPGVYWVQLVAKDWHTVQRIIKQ